MTDLTNKFNNAFERDSVSNVSSIDTRYCDNDEYTGIEYTFEGECVNVRTVIDVVTDTDGHAIESMLHIQYKNRADLTVFVAELPTQEHPGFID